MDEKLTVLPRQAGESLHAYAYRVLYENIMSLRLEPGAAVNEAEIAVKLGVSRTPVHEAITELKEAGLIDILPRKGTRVSKINLMRVSEGSFIRSNVEAGVIPLIIGHVPEEILQEMQKLLNRQRACLDRQDSRSRFYVYDCRFHDLLFKAANMERIGEFVQKINIHGLRISYLIDYDGSYFHAIEENSYLEHLLLFSLIKRERALDFDLSAFLYQHIVRFQKYIEPYIDRYRRFFSFTGDD